MPACARYSTSRAALPGCMSTSSERREQAAKFQMQGASVPNNEPLLDWQDGQPWSRRFGDVYFSRGGGLAETRHVFLSGNRLHDRFRAMRPGAGFVIGETGFGTGLNFLC